MAHSKQAKKRVRQAEARKEANKQFKSKVRTDMKKFDTAVQEGDKEAISLAFKQAMSSLHRAVSKKIFKKGFAARHISKMAAKIRGNEESK